MLGAELEQEYNFGLPKLRCFKIASYNITSLPKHIDERRLYVHQQTLDFLALNETRLDQTISDIL